MGSWKTMKVKRGGKTVTKKVYVPSSSKKKSSGSSGGSSSGKSSNDPNKYKYSYGGKSYENKADATAAARAAKGGSSSGGSTPISQLSDAQKANYSSQLDAIKQTLLQLQQKAKSPTTPTASSGGGSSYTGGSIVDYLGSTGQDSSFSNRSKLASQYGINNYTGTAAQNTQLLNTLRSGSVSSNGGVNTGSPIPSSVVTQGGLTPEQVLQKRQELENAKTQLLSVQEQLDRLQQVSEADPFSLEGVDNPNPLTDPDTLLARYFQNDTYDLTKAERERDRLLNSISDTTSDYYKNREKELSNAYKQFGVDAKTESLAQIQKEMAERQKKLREDTQRLETDASFRGVSRDFANDQRERIKSVGTFDLANLAIVESAYAGDLDRSRELAQTLVDDQFNAFTGQIESYKAQLQALMPQLNEDQKRRALAIELALDERTRKIEQAKADQELKYEYATLAAEMNAPLDVTRAIINSKSADEAFMLAAPYMKEKGTISTGSSGATRGGITATPFSTTSADGKYTTNWTGNPQGQMSPWSAGLAKINIATASNKDIENAARTEFSDAMSARIFSLLTQEQLRDFLIKYEQFQMQEGMNTDPEEALQAYLGYIGKAEGGSSGGSSGSVYDEIDSFKF